MYSTKTVKISNSDTQIINLVPAQKRIQYEKSRIIKKMQICVPLIMRHDFNHHMQSQLITINFLDNNLGGNIFHHWCQWAFPQQFCPDTFRTSLPWTCEKKKPLSKSMIFLVILRALPYFESTWHNNPCTWVFSHRWRRIRLLG